MADRPSDDHRIAHGDGLGEGPQERDDVAATTAEDEQTLSDSEQTLSDTDQTLADTDQASADSDQTAADRDQAASDRDLAAGVDPREHSVSQDIRARSAVQRHQAADARVTTAERRDAIADVRDVDALVRDQAANARDRATAERHALHDDEDRARVRHGTDIVLRAAGYRKRAAAYREDAAAHRAAAAADRRAAAEDREQAARERRRALVDREMSARRVALAETDPLTGARTRAAGLIDLDRELDRCRRTGSRLVIAYVDAVGLKSLNDSAGHAAGDDLLKRIVLTIRAYLRSYDLVVRHGGDEFLCAMPNLTIPDARSRFRTIVDVLSDDAKDGTIRTGFAELTSEETAAQLIALADRELIAQRQREHGPLPRPGDNGNAAA